MPLATISYHKVSHLPIYYRVDWGARLIESLKAWYTRPQSADVFTLKEEFARNITQMYPLVSRERYLMVRRGILQPTYAAHHRSDLSDHLPGPRDHRKIEADLLRLFQFGIDDPG